jgi:hypothetical protein
VIVVELNYQTHSLLNALFGLFRVFERLRTFCMQSEILFSGCCEGFVAFFRFKAMFPCIVESFIFYRVEGLVENEDLGK